MKKKIIIAVLAAFAAATVAFSACEKSDYSVMRSAFTRINGAVAAEKLIEVKSGDTVLSSVEEVYESDAGVYLVTTTTTTLNPIGEGDGMYATEVDGPVTKSYIVAGRFPVEGELEGAQYSGEEAALTLNAGLSSGYFAELGFEEDDCGDAKIAASLSDGKLVSMRVTYVSSNGNDVSISFIFEY